MEKVLPEFYHDTSYILHSKDDIFKFSYLAFYFIETEKQKENTFVFSIPGINGCP